MRLFYQNQLKEINDSLIEMGKMVEKAIADSMEALLTKDKSLAEQVIANDKEINDMEKDINALAYQLILRQQPVAGDLRNISSAISMATDLERIGDQAEDISEIALILMDQEYVKELIDIPQMGQEVIKMLNGAVNSYIHQDLDLAVQVIKSDDKVDELFDLVKKDLLNLVLTNKENNEQAIDLLMIAKYLERIGDHSQNLAESIYFAISGDQYKGEK